MNDRWEVKKLGDLCELITKGTTPTSIGFKFTDAGVNFIKVESLTESGKIIPGKVAYISSLCHQSMERSQLQVGDILFSIAGALGRIGIVKQEIIPANTNQALAIIRLAKDAEVLVDFLAKYFISDNIYKEIEQLRGGVAQQNLSLGQLRNLKIPRPSIPEQQGIVSILDQAFATIDKAKQNAEKNLQNAKELFESYLQSVFENKDWDRKTLKDVSLVFGRGRSKHRPRNDKKLYGGLYPFIQTGDIRAADHYITKYTQTYNEAGLSQSRLWPKGTICITIAANIAETGVLDFDACFPDSVIGVVVNPIDANSNYVEFLLQSFKSKLQAKGKGSAQDNINLGTFENQRFPFPSIDTQESIAQNLQTLGKKVTELETIYERKLLILEELKKTILHKAFAGELTTKEIPEFA